MNRLEKLKRIGKSRQWAEKRYQVALKVEKSTLKAEAKRVRVRVYWAKRKKIEGYIKAKLQLA